MPSKLLEIFLSAKDNATPAFRSLANSIEDANKKLGSISKSTATLSAIEKARAWIQVIEKTGHFIRDGADAWKEYATGVLTATEAVEKFAKTLPVLGSLVEAGDSLVELIDVLRMSDEEKKKQRERPGEDIRRAKRDTQAASMVDEIYKEYEPKADPLLARRDKLRGQIEHAQKELQKNAAVPGFLSDRAQTDYEMFLDKAIPNYYLTRDIQKIIEGSLVRKVRQFFTVDVVDAFEEVSRSFKTYHGFKTYAQHTDNPIIKFLDRWDDLGHELDDRQDEVDLDAWRNRAQAQRAAEEALMDEEALAAKHEREMWNKIAADENVDVLTRLKAMGKAANVLPKYGNPIPGATSSLFLTGQEEAYRDRRQDKINATWDRIADAVDELLTLGKGADTWEFIKAKLVD